MVTGWKSTRSPSTNRVLLLRVRRLILIALRNKGGGGNPSECHCFLSVPSTAETPLLSGKEVAVSTTSDKSCLSVSIANLTKNIIGAGNAL